VDIIMKKNTKKKVVYPVVQEGSHSTRTLHEDGTVDFVIHWDKLEKDVQKAIASLNKD